MLLPGEERASERRRYRGELKVEGRGGYKGE